MTHLLALDQGTSSSRAIVFRDDGSIASLAQRAFRQIYPQPGWVEHDPLEIFQTQRAVVDEALARGGLGAADIAAAGLTNQRETLVLWDRASGVPLYNAIVWQDRRTAPLCEAMRARGLETLIAQKTGLRLDPYFSATKLRWLLDNIPDARARAKRGELAAGTIDTWLVWQFTRGARHVTDVSNASRTLLFNIIDGGWDAELLALFDIPEGLLPEVLPSRADFGAVRVAGGEIPLAAVVGDQQAALFGQGCVEAGQVKNTYGTGCFMLMHTGERAIASANGLITTRAAQLDAPAFALEGSVFVGGAVVQWMRDELRAFSRSEDIEALAASVPDTAGVVFVPAFAGLGAPYWRADARASIQGLTRGANVAHIARAALESIALQSAALLFAMQRDSGLTVSALKVDGGAVANDLLMQIQADVMQIPVLRPATIETTALGAARLAAGQGAGAPLPIERVFEPQRSADWAAEKLAAFEAAVARSGG